MRNLSPTLWSVVAVEDLPVADVRISYVSPPWKGLNAELSCSLRPSDDPVQVGYEDQWNESGRNDLGTIFYLNASVVRVFETFDRESHHSHKEFLGRALSVGLHALPGFTEAMTM